MADYEPSRYGFTWGPLDVERMASFPRDGGKCRVIGIYRRRAQ